MRVAFGGDKKSGRPTIFEVGACCAGVVLLISFFQIRADQENQRKAGVEYFVAANTTSVTEPAQIAAGSLGLPSNKPDQTLWSEQRIEAFSESLAIGGEPPLAVLSIDRLAIQVPVYNGADEHNLNRGVARVLGTARINEHGNLGVAGHRDGFFRPLKDIATGDLIELMTPDGMVRYEVTKTSIVNPDDVEVLAPTSERTLTLVTCFPFYWVGDAPQRFIVTAIAQPVATT